MASVSSGCCLQRCTPARGAHRPEPGTRRRARLQCRAERTLTCAVRICPGPPADSLSHPPDALHPNPESRCERCETLDWTAPAAALGEYDVVLGCDIFSECDTMGALAAFLCCALRAGGAFVGVRTPRWWTSRTAAMPRGSGTSSPTARSGWCGLSARARPSASVKPMRMRVELPPMCRENGASSLIDPISA